MNKQKTFVETPSHTDTSIITASDAALRYIAALHGTEVPLEPFSAAVTAQALASALHPYKTPHGREADSKMVMAISTTQHQAERAAVAMPHGYHLVADATLRRAIVSLIDRVTGHTLSCNETAVEQLRFIKEIAAAAQAEPLSAALAEIAAERRRQVEQERWTPDRDDRLLNGQLATAAGYYALAAGWPHERDIGRGLKPQYWPFNQEWWKPTTARHNLVKAGALIAAEIERIDRAAQKGGAAC